MDKEEVGLALIGAIFCISTVALVISYGFYSKYFNRTHIYGIALRKLRRDQPLIGNFLMVLWLIVSALFFICIVAAAALT